MSNGGKAVLIEAIQEDFDKEMDKQLSILRQRGSELTDAELRWTVGRYANLYQLKQALGSKYKY